MVDSFTDNKGLILQVTGSNTGTWGSLLNTSDITVTDAILGKTLSVSLASSNVALSQIQSQNLAFALSGTLSANITITLPLNFNSLTVAVGGFFIFDNETTGAFTVTVKTVASGSTGVDVPQGLRCMLYSDGTNIYFANDGAAGTAWYIRSTAGDPNGSVIGIPASATAPASMIWDRTNTQLYVCTAAPTTWTLAAVTKTSTPVSGYLTINSSTSSPIVTTNTLSATTLYYTPLTGNVIGIPNGSTFSYFNFSQLTLALSSTYQAASNIYDVFAFLNAGVVTLAFGPSWFAGGGSVTPGSCSRGSGPSSTQLTRLLGTLVNAVSMTANNGATTYTIGAQTGIYLGSIFVDSSAGQVSCYRALGQNTKWGVWNYYNRQPITVQVADPTASWAYNSATLRFSNNTINNRSTSFIGFAEDETNVNFQQAIQGSTSPVSGVQLIAICIGQNLTTASGTVGTNGYISFSTTANIVGATVNARYVLPPALGIQNWNMLEVGLATGNSCLFYSSNGAAALMTAQWRG